MSVQAQSNGGPFRIEAKSRRVLQSSPSIKAVAGRVVAVFLPLGRAPHSYSAF